MAIGAYMALRSCSEQAARTALIQAARDARAGLGAVSQALLIRVSDAGSYATTDDVLAYWREQLESPATPRPAN